MAKLTFVLEDGQEVVVPLSGLITLGRDDDNDVVIDDERISRHHAELLSHPDGRIEVQDLGSTAGTFVNDRPIRNHIIRPGDKLAFGPLAARINLEDSPAAPTLEAARAEETRLAQLQADVQDLAKQCDEKSTALQELTAQQAQEQFRLDQLRKDCDQGEHRLGDLRRQLAEDEERRRASKTLADTREEQAQADGKKLDQLGRDQQQAQESLLRVQTELTARADDLAAETRCLDEAKARLAGIEAQCQALAITEEQLAQAREALITTERQQAEAQSALQQARAQLAEQEDELQKASSAETSAQNHLADLSAREKDLRVELEKLGPGIETTRNELAAIESRLAPLRDWKKSMDQRYARLATLPQGSAEESALWREIEEAQAVLFDLLPAARITTPGLTRGDFARISAKAGVPMKSDRIRRAGS